MNKEKRREEIVKLWNEQRKTYCNFFDVIIFQEQAMIDEAVREFAKDLYVSIPDTWYMQTPKFWAGIQINKLLQDRGVKEI